MWVPWCTLVQSQAADFHNSHHLVHAWSDDHVATMAASSSSTPEMLPAVSLPIYTSRVSLPVHLSPAYLASPMDGVRDLINRSVLQCAPRHTRPTQRRRASASGGLLTCGVLTRPPLPPAQVRRAV